MERRPQDQPEPESLTLARAVADKSRGAEQPRATSRRAFLKAAGAATVASIATAAVGLEPILGGKRSTAAAQDVDSAMSVPAASTRARAVQRRNASYKYRVRTAAEEFHVPIPAHASNGDETLFPNFIGNFSKGLPHDANGEVVPSAYNKLLAAVNSGKPADFNAIPMGGVSATPLINPQSGLAFDLIGTDSHQLLEPPAPPVASAWRAGEAVENYWMALLRDVPFSQYGSDPIAQAAIADLNKLSDFRGPKVGGNVTAGTLFRGFTAGDVIGPYISQYFYPTLAFGAGQIVQQYLTYNPGSDSMTDFASFLSCQNGTPSGSNSLDPTRRYLRNGRDIGAWVHVDVLYQAYFHACLYLVGIGAKLNPGNPYAPGNPAAANQTGFGTFGVPYLKAILAAVSSRALKAQWFQKWYVHRALRPEAYGGLVHLKKTNTKPNYPINSEVLDSDAVARTFSNNGTYLLPMEFHEGCPQHPAYGSGHATVGGACVTILKAFFDETQVIQNPVVPSDDGLSLVAYTGNDASLLTVGGELNKIASNVAFGRNIAGVHWRTDAEEAMKLGEAVAISILRDERGSYNEDFQGFTFTKFDGTQITV
jgi:hypothetical protein